MVLLRFLFLLVVGHATDVVAGMKNGNDPLRVTAIGYRRLNTTNKGAGLEPAFGGRGMP